MSTVPGYSTARTPTVAAYTGRDDEEWDAFVERSRNGTLLHTRRYLSYHRARFTDASLRVLDHRGRLIGVFPAALDPDNPKLLVSHPGITYGGLVRGAALQGTAVVDALGAVLEWYRELGFEAVLYKAIPTVYQALPAQDDLYALFIHGAQRTRCDLSAAVDVERRPASAPALGRRQRKAMASGIRIEHGPRHLAEFWGVLAAALTRHGAVPVHSLAEMAELFERFPDHISLSTAFLGEELVAGNVLYATPRTVHCQYRAASDTGRAVGAQDLLDEVCIERTTTDGKTFFNFGISTERAGRELNDGLFRYKAKFGAGGVVHEFYECRL